MNSSHSILLIVIMTLITAALRMLPFAIFTSGKNTNQTVIYLGKYLPPGIMAMLVVYCLRGVDLTTAPNGIPEALAILLIVPIHLKFKNSLISIGAGTAFYMFLVQTVFA